MCSCRSEDAKGNDGRNEIGSVGMSVCVRCVIREARRQRATDGPWLDPQRIAIDVLSCDQRK